MTRLMNPSRRTKTREIEYVRKMSSILEVTSLQVLRNLIPPFTQSRSILLAEMPVLSAVSCKRPTSTTTPFLHRLPFPISSGPDPTPIPGPAAIAQPALCLHSLDSLSSGPSHPLLSLPHGQGPLGIFEEFLCAERVTRRRVNEACLWFE